MLESLEVTERDIEVLSEVLKPRLDRRSNAGKCEKIGLHCNGVEECIDRIADALGVDFTTINLCIDSAVNYKNSKGGSVHYTNRASIWRYRFMVWKDASVWRSADRPLYWITLILPEKEYREYMSDLKFEENYLDGQR